MSRKLRRKIRRFTETKYDNADVCFIATLESFEPFNALTFVSHDSQFLGLLARII